MIKKIPVYSEKVDIKRSIIYTSEMKKNENKPTGTFMLKQLRKELAGLELRYHEMDERAGRTIRIYATDLDPYGVDEVMRIKAVADRFHAHTSWDGRDIKIVHASEKQSIMP